MEVNTNYSFSNSINNIIAVFDIFFPFLFCFVPVLSLTLTHLFLCYLFIFYALILLFLFFISGIKTIEIGVKGTQNMLELARACKARFLISSTSEVYGDPDVVSCFFVLFDVVITLLLLIAFCICYSL